MENILIPFPASKLSDYLKSINAKSIDMLGVHLVEKVFLLVVNDFLQGIVSVDQLALISRVLLDRLNLIAKNESEIGYVLEDVCELHFYIRQIRDDVCAQVFVSDLQRALDYFERNKYLIER
jgi:hypothetical protein